MAFTWNTLIIFLTILIAVIIQVTYSQTVWIDVDTGKVLGVTQSQSGKPNNQQQIPTHSYGNNRQPYHNNNHNHNRYNTNNNNNYDYGRQPNNNLNPEWVCRNSKTGDTMIIASEIMTSRFPEQLQPNYQPPDNNNNNNDNYNQPENHYQDNPWLNGQNNNNNNHEKQPPQPQPQPQPQPIPSTPRTPREEPTPPPIILTTKRPFPTLDNIDWTKYLEGTTTRRTPVNKLNEAIDGGGIIEPRGGDARYVDN